MIWLFLSIFQAKYLQIYIKNGEKSWEKQAFINDYCKIKNAVACVFILLIYKF